MSVELDMPSSLMRQNKEGDRPKIRHGSGDQKGDIATLTRSHGGSDATFPISIV